MAYKIVDINIMTPKEWMMTSGNVVFETDKIEIKASIEVMTIIVYFNADTLFKIPLPKIIQEPYNSYKIFCMGHTTEKLEVQIGITRYFEDDSTLTQFYKINEVIEVGSEGVEAFSFILKCIGTGEFRLHQLRVSTFLNSKAYHTVHKDKKVSEVVSEIVIPRPKKNLNKKSVKIATILDEFSFEAFKEEAQCYPITSENWKEEINTFKPEVLFVESAWHGKNKSWEQKIACYKQECDKTLKDLVQYCKVQGIKTVFWNKEGLVNFEYFKSASTLFETVFVTDEHIIPMQKQLCGHERVYVLPFAAQPQIHNSINKYTHYLGGVAFGGNWYGEKHPKRLVDMQNIVEPALEFDLDIYDRSYEKREQLMEVGYYWPYPYRSAIVGGVPYEIMIQLYKYYNIFLNVNSVQDSICMIARRVYEIMMAKTVIVSGYSLGISSQFKDYIYCPQSTNETKKILEQLLYDPILRAQKGKKGQRYILENHTYEKRIEEIFGKIDVLYEVNVKAIVTIIVWGESLDLILNIYDKVKRQNYEKISLKVFYPISNKKVETSSLQEKGVEFYAVEPQNLIQTILSKCTQGAFGEYIAMLHSNYVYGENYIRDYVNTFKYIEADIIGKSTTFYYVASSKQLYKVNYGKGEDCYCESIVPGSWMARCTAVTDEMLKALLKEDSIQSYMKRLSEKEYMIYSDDAFNMCMVEDYYVPSKAQFITDTSNYTHIVEI